MIPLVPFTQSSCFAQIHCLVFNGTPGTWLRASSSSLHTRGHRAKMTAPAGAHYKTSVSISTAKKVSRTKKNKKCSRCNHALNMKIALRTVKGYSYCWWEPWISWSHRLPCFVHGLNVFLGFHPQRGNARASLIHILQRVLISECCRALVRWRGHCLHPLAHGWRGVQETMACISWLKALRRAHEPWDAVHGRGTGQRRGQPWVQGQRVGHWSHVGVHRRPVEGEHRRVVELHAARVHLLLPPPFGSAILEPHLCDVKCRV